MIDDAVEYKTPTELFLSAARKGLSVEETLSMEMERSGRNRSYADRTLNRYLEKGYLLRDDGKLIITDAGLEELNHPGKPGRKAKNKTGVAKSPEEIYGTSYPFYPKREEDALGYWGQPVLFQEESAGTGEKPVYYKRSDNRGTDLFMKIGDTEVPVMFENYNGLWRWTGVSTLLMAIQYKGSAKICEIEEALKIQDAHGINLYWALNRLSDRGLIAGPRHIWGRNDRADKNSIVGVSPKGEAFLKGLYDSLYADGGKFSDVLYANYPDNCQEILAAISGSKIPSVKWLIETARGFFPLFASPEPKKDDADSSIKTAPIYPIQDALVAPAKPLASTIKVPESPLAYAGPLRYIQGLTKSEKETRGGIPSQKKEMW
jgi:hypothetical protein